MRMYAIENAAKEIDITSIRYTKQEVRDLIEARRYAERNIPVWIMEYDDGKNKLEDMINGFHWRYPLSAKIGEGVTCSQVWPVTEDKPGRKEREQ